MKICILYGGVSSEREVSLNTGKSIYNAIKNEYDVVLYDFNGNYNLMMKCVSTVDLVFVALHGGDGENGIMQKFLESNKIKFTGSGSVASEIAMCKNQTKVICKKYNILTPQWLLVSSNSFDFKKEKFNNIEEFQEFIIFLANNNSGLVIKPNNQGSSVGVTIFKKIKTDISSIEKQRKLIGDATIDGIKKSNTLLWEEYIDGRELTVSILNNKVLPIVEIIPKGDYYDYKCKYTKFQSDYVVPAKINKETELLLSAYSLKIHKLIGSGVYSRVDFRLSKDNKVYFLELNTLPGFTDTSLFPKSAEASGLGYRDLIKKIIEST